MAVPDPLPIQHDTPVDLDHADMEKSSLNEKEQAPVDDPFGNEECGEVKYRVMKWW